MHKNDINKFFHMATHGDKEAYKLLYKEFVNRANLVVLNTVKNNSNFSGFPGDFCDLIDDLFFKAINEYEPEKRSFSSYVDYLFSHRLANAVRSEIHDIESYIADVDYEDENIKSIELLSDPQQPTLQNEIAMNNFKVLVASPNKHKSKDRRLRDKVLTFKYAGYNNQEICNKLNLSYSQLRRILVKAEDDDDIANIKLDLK